MLQYNTFVGAKGVKKHEQRDAAICSAGTHIYDVLITQIGENSSNLKDDARPETEETRGPATATAWISKSRWPQTHVKHTR